MVETWKSGVEFVKHPIDTTVNTAIGLYDIASNPNKYYDQVVISVDEWQTLYKYALNNDPKLAGQMDGYLQGKVGASLASIALSGPAAKAIQVGVKASKQLFNIKTVSASKIDMAWGGGIKKQGMPWEDYVGNSLSKNARLPANFKTFDFYDQGTGKAISVKTLNTLTDAKVKNPKQIYTSMKKSIDDAANFKTYNLSAISLNETMITSREIQMAIPSKTTVAQWSEINRAMQYARDKGVNLIVTEIKWMFSSESSSHVSVYSNKDLISIIAMSGYRMRRLDLENDGIGIFDKDISDRKLGAEITNYLLKSRVLTLEECEVFFEPERVQSEYQTWVLRLIEYERYKTKNALFKNMKLCSVSVQNGVMEISPNHHEKLEGWSGTDYTEKHKESLPINASTQEIGEALRRALGHCTGR